jgi:PAS domain S-box-containing protein
LSTSVLPKGSIVINKEFTIWDFKYYIVGGLALCLVQSLLIAGLLLQRCRRRLAEGSLRQRTEELGQFFNVSLDLLGIANTDGYFLRLNPAAERVLGYTREELMAGQFFDFIHPDDVDRTREAVSALGSQQKVFLFENRYRCKDGTYRWLEWSSAPAGKLIYAAARDVTERKRAEVVLQENERTLRQSQNDLRELTGRLISAQEEEKSRLARELHDDLAQRLAALSIDAGKLEQRLMNSPGPIKEGLNDMKNQVVAISGDIHNLARQLHPSILDDLGLARAIESECIAFMKREGVNIIFNHDNIPNIVEKDVSLTLYRIIQEGLRNISKHACANHVSVSLNGFDQDILLSIRDDGIGFDLAEARLTSGLGLSSLRERVRLVHGELSVKSQPGEGTAITVKAPLNSKGTGE